MVCTEGYVYFVIKTEDINIDEEFITSYLGVQATTFKKMNSNGDIPKCSSWILSTERRINPNIREHINRIISMLLPCEEKLISLKNAYPTFIYVFEIVIFHGDNAEGFSIDTEQLRFLNNIGALIDVDQYNWKD